MGYNGTVVPWFAENDLGKFGTMKIGRKWSDKEILAEIYLIYLKSTGKFIAEDWEIRGKDGPVSYVPYTTMKLFFILAALCRISSIAVTDLPAWTLEF